MPSLFREELNVIASNQVLRSHSAVLQMSGQLIKQDAPFLLRMWTAGLWCIVLGRGTKVSPKGDGVGGVPPLPVRVSHQPTSTIFDSVCAALFSRVGERVTEGHKVLG